MEFKFGWDFKNRQKYKQSQKYIKNSNKILFSLQSWIFLNDLIKRRLRTILHLNMFAKTGHTLIWIAFNVKIVKP